MAMHIPKAPGFASMLKDGAKHLAGIDEAVLRNIDACKELAKTTRSAYGPNGQNKMVINHLEKLFVTSDAATILRELEVQHPAAKMLVMASHQQEQECGDGTNFVLVFAGALLEKSEDLLSMGLSITEVISGYEMASKKAAEILPNLVCHEVHDLRDKKEVTKAIRTAVMSKQFGNEDFLSQIITEACISVFKEKNTFSVDSIRVCKISGAGVTQSHVLSGMVLKRQVEGDITKAESCKVAVFSCPLDIMQTETKGTVLIKTAKELMDYSKGEENIIESQVRSIAESGVKVVVTGGKVGELALHYANKYKLMIVRLTSKWDLRRLAKTIGAVVLPKITVPTPDEMGHCDHAQLDEIGGTPVVVFKQESESNPISTIVIRGSTENVMDDIERAIDDGVNTFKCLTKDGRMVAGAGATEIELAKQISSYGETCPGLEQYAIQKFAEALEVLPRAVAQNSGVKATEVVSKLFAAHHAGNSSVGVDIMGDGPAVVDAAKSGILDVYISKAWSVKLATDSANTVLKVDQIIMAKPAGGPKPKENKNWDED